MAAVIRPAAIPLTALAALAATAVAATAAVDPDAVGPQTRIQPNGRQLAPYGKLSPLANHPGGGALTPNGRYLWALNSGRGANSIQIVDADPAQSCKPGKRGAKCRRKASKRAGKVIQTIPMPGLSGGIAMSPDRRTAYVSGVADSEHLDEKAPAGTPGLEGDTVHSFTYDPRTGLAKRGATIPVPPPAG